MPVMRKAPEKLFTKVIVAKGYGFNTPQDGSVCKIKILSDEAKLLSGLDEEQTKEIFVGDVDEPIDRIIEDCVRTMKEEEVCYVEFPHPNINVDIIIPVNYSGDIKTINDGTLLTDGQDDVKDKNGDLSLEENTINDSDSDLNVQSQNASSSDVETENVVVLDKHRDISSSNSAPEVSECDAQENVGSDTEPHKLAKIEFQLLSYTREPEIWEMSVTEKWRRASYHKQRGLELYARGIYQYAFRRFGLTLKYIISLEHDVPSGQEEGMDIKGLKLSCYLNVAACQMRHHNFESVVINSSKALMLQPNNAKALYRRGAAYLQLQEYEKAKEDLTAAQHLEPENQAIAKQLQILKTRVQKLNQYYASAMKKMFS